MNMEKSKHEYEVEIQNLNQQLMLERTKRDESMKTYEEVKKDVEREIDRANKIIERMAMIITVLLDKLESEDKS